MIDMDYTGMDSDRMFGAGESVTLLDQIKADREAGTPGNFDLSAVSIIWRGGHQSLMDAGADVGAVMSALVGGTADADVRRIARVPDMEAALLAAGELADAAERMESELGCDDIRCMCETVRAAIDAFRSAIEVK